MSDLYLYLSENKISQLAAQHASRFSEITAKLEFKLPFVSSGVSGKNRTAVTKDLAQLVPRLQKKYMIEPFETLSRRKKSRVFFSFSGAAALHKEDDGYYIAMEQDSVALLLAGSVRNVLGGQDVEAQVSGSADPIGAFKALCEARSTITKDVSFDLTYIWQELLRASGESTLKPRVEGIAVFTARLRADEMQKNRIDRKDVEWLVVGTPLYVRQIE